MGWKIGAIGFGITTAGFALLSSLLLAWAFDLEGQRKVEKTKRECMESIIDIQQAIIEYKN